MAQIHVNKYNGWLRRDVEGLSIKQPRSKQNYQLTTFLRLIKLNVVYDKTSWTLSTIH